MDPNTNKTIRRAIRLDRAAQAQDDFWPGFDLELLTQARKYSLLMAGLRRPKPRWRLLSRKKE